MSKLVGFLRSIYRRIVPASVKKSRLGASLKRFAYAHVLGHDSIYDWDYYANVVEGPAVRAADAISESILLDLRPKTAIDVGCGTGALLAALRARGCQVLGLEYSEVALRYCRQRELNVWKCDLERDTLPDDRTFDVAISMEVAEHLPEKIADRYVDLLTRLSSVIVFTAAAPGQGEGHDHVNEQPPSYWISRFQASGFAYDEELSSRWRERWRARIFGAAFYYWNLMIFRRVEAQ